MSASQTVRILVVYDSRTGNTEEMAKAVAEGASLKGAQVNLKRAEDVRAEDFLENDGFAIGTPTHFGLMSAKINRVFNETAGPAWGKVQGKVGAAFSSSGGLGGGNEIALLSVIFMMLNYGMLVMGITDYIAPGVTLHYGAVSVGRPGEEQLSACRLLGERPGELSLILKLGRSLVGSS